VSLRVELPFPPPDLSPNARVHWRVKADAVRTYRHDVDILTLVARPHATRCNPWPHEGEIALTVTFCPPDNRRRDRDNMMAAFKAGFDGIADALCVDDSVFVPTYRKGDVVKGGKVIVEIA
jgi:crossover junction endodeoxyribonuclease RusA